MQELRRSLAVLMAVVTAPWLASAAAPVSTSEAPGASTAAKALDLFPDTVVAKGKGFEIKRSQLDAEAVPKVAQYAAAGRPLSPDQRLLLDQSILEQLIDLKLLQAKATEADRATGYVQADKQFEAVKAQLDTPDKMDRQLKVWGVTNIEQVHARYREGGVAEAVLLRELTVNVSEDDVKKEYAENKSKFEQPEMVRAIQILFSTRDPLTGQELSQQEKEKKRKEAEDVLKRARAGEDFAALAKQSSAEANVKDRGRELMISRQMASAAPELEAAIFSLGTNKISNIVTTMYGLHIVKVIKKYDAHQADLNDEILINPTEGYFVVKKSWTEPPDSTWKTETPAAVVRRALEGQQRTKAAPEFLAKLSKDASVEILDESLKPKEGSTPSGRPPMVPPGPGSGSK